MYNGPYFMPNFYSNIAPNMIRGTIGNTALRGLANTRGLGIFGRLNNSLNFFKNLNWTGLINNTSKTLNIINQSIPVVKQVKPMMNNMKSMLKIASIFKDETDTKSTKINHIPKTENNTTNQNIKKEKKQEEDYSPTFFITT